MVRTRAGATTRARPPATMKSPGTSAGNGCNPIDASRIGGAMNVSGPLSEPACFWRSTIASSGGSGRSSSIHHRSPFQPSLNPVAPATDSRIAALSGAILQSRWFARSVTTFPCESVPVITSVPALLKDERDSSRRSWPSRIRIHSAAVPARASRPSVQSCSRCRR